MAKELANTIIILCVTVGAALGGAIGIRAALDQPLLPWQSEAAPKDSDVLPKPSESSGALHKGDYPPGDSFGLFAPHEEDDLGFNCLMHGNMSC